jgi:hypothetical protein
MPTSARSSRLVLQRIQFGLTGSVFFFAGRDVRGMSRVCTAWPALHRTCTTPALRAWRATPPKSVSVRCFSMECIARLLRFLPRVCRVLPLLPLSIASVSVTAYTETGGQSICLFVAAVCVSIAPVSVCLSVSLLRCAFAYANHMYIFVHIHYITLIFGDF